MTSGKRIAVLIPVYNEALTIAKVVRDFKQALPEAEIYVYDNNSSDGSAQLAAEAGAVVRRERRQGKGNVVRSMFRDIDADCYILTDGDDTYPAQSAPQLASLVLDAGYDMVIGDRLSSTYFTENKRRFHNAGNRLVRMLINLLFNKKIDFYEKIELIDGLGGGEYKNSTVTDIMTGYRAFSPLFAKGFPVLSQGFEIETEMTVQALDKNFAVAALPIEYQDRPEGSTSKLNTVSDGIKVLRTIYGLLKNFRPLFFFNVVALLLAVIGILFLIPVLSEYFSTGLVPRFPTFIASGFAALGALLAFFSGVILDVLTRKHRQDYELQLNQLRLLLNLSKDQQK